MVVDVGARRACSAYWRHSSAPGVRGLAERSVVELGQSLRLVAQAGVKLAFRLSGSRISDVPPRSLRVRRCAAIESARLCGQPPSATIVTAKHDPSPAGLMAVSILCEAPSTRLLTLAPAITGSAG